MKTDDVVVSLTNMTGVVSHDPEAQTETVYAGTTLEEAGTELHDRNLALPNLGDVTMQTVAGAFGTGTYGTGPEFDADSDPDLLHAARVSLGALGIFTEVQLDLRTTYKL